jgi:hypothetical protein
MAKYRASFVDGSTLDWEQYLPAHQFSYNTSYHSTISTMPFELLYGMKPRTPSIPGKMFRENFTENHLRWNDFKSCRKSDRLQKKTWTKAKGIQKTAWQESKRA